MLPLTLASLSPRLLATTTRVAAEAAPWRARGAVSSSGGAARARAAPPLIVLIVVAVIIFVALVLCESM